MYNAFYTNKASNGEKCHLLKQTKKKACNIQSS